MIRVADLVICSAREAQGLIDNWRGNKIAGVINVAWNIGASCDIGENCTYCPRTLNKEVNYYGVLPVLRQPARDEATPQPIWFDPILSFYDTFRYPGGSIIVHCHAGANRSKGTAGVILAKRHGMSFEQACAAVVYPGHPAWIAAIKQAVG